MKELKFKTNINCGSCVAKVGPALETAEGVCEWTVDTSSRDKVLIIKTEQLTDSDIIATVAKAGFNAEVLQ
ncbi:heavy-metal-associated domain-containing protein [Cesiribacter sp. SM1]|uniref:heavy-metal-associated domain-containing protein n=1 Tax=Cesiribacter sp. SM1 TaxID=2861196 RepID=UPI001CD57A1F|nr:heavy-metal-associated domain-containing protein [Cesiribacter sp. SM1]